MVVDGSDGAGTFVVWLAGCGDAATPVRGDAAAASRGWPGSCASPRGDELDVAAIVVAEAATAAAPRTTAAAIHQRLLRPDPGTTHCRGWPGRVGGSAATRL